MRTDPSDHLLARLMGLHPKIIDLTLDRVLRLLDQVGSPHKRLPPVVHLAGTNGKGSTLAFLRAIAEAAGQRVHAYTSPHLVRFHERIRLAGELIDETALAAVLERCERANGGEPITYFEITTVAAFLAFAETPADLLLLETGLGGRLDATNVVDQPALTVITSISRDHMQYLGDSLASIAGEKAGILKPGVPCLSAPQPPEVVAVLEARAAALAAPLMFVEPLPSRAGLSLLGDHQRTNAALAASAARELGYSEAAIARGLATAVWPARFQRLAADSYWGRQLPSDVALWLDGGHNAAAGEVIAEQLRSDWAGQRVHVIYGMLNTKEAGAFLAPIAPLAASLTAIAIPDADASLSAEAAAAAAAACGRSARPKPSLTAALADLPLQSGDSVLICGSLYLAGWVLAQADEV